MTRATWLGQRTGQNGDTGAPTLTRSKACSSAATSALTSGAALYARYNSCDSSSGRSPTRSTALENRSSAAASSPPALNSSASRALRESASAPLPDASFRLTQPCRVAQNRSRRAAAREVLRRDGDRIDSRRPWPCTRQNSLPRRSPGDAQRGSLPFGASTANFHHESGVGEPFWVMAGSAPSSPEREYPNRRLHPNERPGHYEQLH